MPAMLPYYHPTTVAFIDDNDPFLSSLRLFAPDSTPTEYFYSPNAALEWVNRLTPGPSLADKCFSNANGDLQFDLDVLEQEIQSANRFARVSVVVVDYAMPSMDGLEFCAQVQDPDIRKVLLTGVADEKIAVDAFNRGLIHRYLPKAGLGSLRKVFQLVQDLQREYFEQQARFIRTGLGSDSPPVLWANELRETFDALCREHETVEFYLVSRPQGYLLLNREGVATRVIIMTDDDLHREAARCVFYGAPAPISAAIVSGDKIPYLMEDPRDYPEIRDYPWDEVLYKAQQIGEYHIAKVDNPPADIDFDTASASYAGWQRSKSDNAT